ncbi:Cof-type HAD-IIB family hydrolase [Sinobaca sp. H24]|uniref:Cof-type HAD-IIB family hydrolase n=1 Tax=Sinobaca sp. H24 TaxID=2923376 RepID=UPI00207A03E4|nr:Cof-type HAD-IIB family hydrolase [Sinobaca sp. H24]
MEKKLLFFDIDGTLLDHKKQIPASTKHAIFELHKAGHEVAISTGRAPYLFQGIQQELNIDSFVCFNGQYVQRRGEAIRKNPIDLKAIEEINGFSEARDHPVIYMSYEGMRANVPFHEDIEKSISTLKAVHPDHDSDYYKHHNIYQMLLFCGKQEENEYHKYFDNLDFIRWHELSMDILPPGGSKAKGIEQYMFETGTKPENVYAFGDYLNDIEMLKFVENSVAMGDAPDVVKESAKYVTTGVENDGIYNGLKYYGLVE